MYAVFVYTAAQDVHVLMPAPVYAFTTVMYPSLITNLFSDRPV